VQKPIVIELYLEPVFFDRDFGELDELVGRQRLLHQCFLRWPRSRVEVKEM
jgi:hypothetical protein